MKRSPYFIAWTERGAVVVGAEEALSLLENGVEVSEVTGLRPVRNIIMHDSLIEASGMSPPGWRGAR